MPAESFKVGGIVKIYTVVSEIGESEIKYNSYKLFHRHVPESFGKISTSELALNEVSSGTLSPAPNL